MKTMQKIVLSLLLIPTLCQASQLPKHTVVGDYIVVDASRCELGKTLLSGFVARRDLIINFPSGTTSIFYEDIVSGKSLTIGAGIKNVYLLRTRIGQDVIFAEPGRLHLQDEESSVRGKVVNAQVFQDRGTNP
jgi:glutamine phosphoribosylpyrophosphate amidotransferase